MVKGVHLSISVILSVTVMGFTEVCSLQQQISKYIYNNNGYGTYSFEFKTADGTYRKEDGGLLSDPQADSLVVRGEYGYFDTLGRLYSVKYIADENGFQPLITQDDTRFNDRRIV